MSESDDATIAQQSAALEADATLAQTQAGSAAGSSPNRSFPGSPGAPRPELLTGYTIVDEKPLGEGGMGVVWKAVQLSTKRLVALKVMSAAGFGSERARLRFEREVELTAKLDHPHIARIYDSGLERGICFYAMELIDGRKLDEHIRAERLNRRQIIELMKVICRAVQYAHQKGIIHRDLKPSNIVVDRQGEPHILDFGLAKAMESNDQLSIDGEAAGTPAYMSPEQASGRLDKLDTRSDVYTLGVILFFLLSGKYPHDTKGSVIEVMSRISHEEALRLRSVDTESDRELDVLLSKAMEKEPERRYGSAGALADDLERYLHNEPLSAQPPTLSYILRKRLRRYRVQVFTAGAMAVVLLGIAVWAYAKIAIERNAAITANVEKDEQRAEAQRQSSIARSNEALALRNESQAKANADEAGRQRAAAQHRLFEMCIREGRKELEDRDTPLALLWFTQALDAAVPGSVEEQFTRTYISTTLRYAMQGQLLTAPLQHQDAVYYALFSPDGALIVTVEAREAQVWETATGRAVGNPIADVHVAAFSRDGKKLLVGGKESARILDTSTWKALTPPLAHKGSIRAVAFSADGSKAVIGSDDRTARVWDAQTGQPITEPLKHAYVIFNASFSPDGTRVVTADGEAHVWNASSGFLLASVGKGGQIIDAQFNPEGTRIMTAGNEVRLWNVATSKPIGLPLMSGGDLSMCLSPDGRKVLAGSANRLQLLDATSGAPIGPPLARGGIIGPYAFSPDGSRVVTVSTDEAARVWDVATSRMLVGPLAHNGNILSASFSPDGSRVITTSADRTARLWNAAAHTPRPRPWGRRFSSGMSSLSAAFSFDGRKAIICQDRDAQVWDIATAAPVTPLLRHATYVYYVAIDRGGRRVATTDHDHSAHLWDARTGEPIGAALLHGDDVNALAFSDDGTKLVTACEDATACIWDAATGRLVGPPLRHKQSVLSACFTHDGSRVLTAGAGGFVMWETATGKCLASAPLDDMTPLLISAVFSPDERKLVTIGEDTAVIWELASGKHIGARLAHDAPINSVAFSADGSKIVTAGDKTARIWDASTGKPLTLWLRHEDEVSAAAFNSDGTRVVTACWDGTARIWDVATGQPIAAPLLHDGTVLAAAFAPDGLSVVTASNFATLSPIHRGKAKATADPPNVTQTAVRRWDISPDPRPLADLRGLAECVSGRRVHSSGGIVQLRDDELRSLFESLKPRYPNEFLPGSVLMPTVRANQ